MTEAAAKKGLSRPELWAVIRHADLNVPIGSGSPHGDLPRESFEERLGSKLDLTKEDARRLTHEYRRFLYLKAVSGAELTPSARVDQAWHLHMETPGDAWSRYCEQVLAGTVAHRTSLTDEEARAGYERTRRLYQQEFRQPPPGDIWPTDRETRRRILGNGMGVVGVALIIGAPVVRAFGGPEYLPGAMLVGTCILFLLANWFKKGSDIDQIARCA